MASEVLGRLHNVTIFLVDSGLSDPIISRKPMAAEVIRSKGSTGGFLRQAGRGYDEGGKGCLWKIRNKNEEFQRYSESTGTVFASRGKFLERAMLI
jgi:hypothetical protein